MKKLTPEELMSFARIVMGEEYFEKIEITIERKPWMIEELTSHMTQLDAECVADHWAANAPKLEAHPVDLGKALIQGASAGANALQLIRAIGKLVEVS